MYNPDCGIPVYSLDADFPLEEDNFQLMPKKVYTRSDSAQKKVTKTDNGNKIRQRGRGIRAPKETRNEPVSPNKKFQKSEEYSNNPFNKYDKITNVSNFLRTAS